MDKQELGVILVSDQIEPNLRTSELFCSTDANLIFQSSDGVLFHIHNKYLEANTEGFPPAGFDPQNDIVALSEHSTTLELLFQFVYPARHPDLASVEFKTLAPLAEAAEKYQAFSAMVVCKIRMMGTLPKHAEEIMDYAVKHDYPEIMGGAAPLILNKSLEEILMKLPRNLIIPWVNYHSKWANLLKYAASCHTVIYDLGLTCTTINRHHIRHTNNQICRSCSITQETMIVQVFTQLLRGTVSLSQLDLTFDQSFVCCNKMKPGLAAWRSAVELEMSKIPNLITFL
ncbi:hypothetical protein BDZ94DRAFT_1202173 [Collybia nuda]|uniref:BTB domain-containing protein n=1 Tax=Collybia nuda TaxID=64659 RepID=A0A9P5XY18_9AGAR|nr:hypothetical protein BDZ94DRAFT_1202173 [Collybia nuda]